MYCPVIPKRSPRFGFAGVRPPRTATAGGRRAAAGTETRRRGHRPECVSPLAAAQGGSGGGMVRDLACGVGVEPGHPANEFERRARVRPIGVQFRAARPARVRNTRVDGSGELRSTAASLRGWPASARSSDTPTGRRRACGSRPTRVFQGSVGWMASITWKPAPAKAEVIPQRPEGPSPGSGLRRRRTVPTSCGTPAPR